MLVDINLLPQKQQRNSTSIRMMILIIFMFILVSLLITWQVQRYNNDIRNLEVSIAQSEQMIESLQQNQTLANTNSFAELSDAVDWSIQHPIKSVSVLQHLTSLLPERGFLLNYTYTDMGNINLTVQFDTKKEAAFYMKWLNDSEWINEVKLSDLTSSKTDSLDSNVNENYLPRYTGNFEITLNRDRIKLLAKKEGN